jgi:hypothetical protein
VMGGFKSWFGSGWPSGPTGKGDLRRPDVCFLI